MERQPAITDDERRVALVNAASDVAERLEELGRPAASVDRVELRGLADRLRRAIVHHQHVAHVLEDFAARIRSAFGDDPDIAELERSVRDALADLAREQGGEAASVRAREPEPEQKALWARLDLPCDLDAVGDLSKWKIDDPYKED